MKIRPILFAAAVMLLPFSCQKNEDIIVIPQQEEEVIVTQDGVELQTSALEQGHVRLQLSDEMTALAETDPEAFQQLFRSLGVKSLERTFPDAGKFEKRSRAEGLHRWYDLYFDEEMPLTKAGKELSLIDDLGYVEYRPKIERIKSQDVGWRSASPGLFTSDISQTKKTTVDIFDDPYLSQQWHYYNDGSYHASKAGCDINVLPVWRVVTTGSPDVIISVVDGGVDFRHEDLASNMWHDPDYPDSLVCGFNFVHRDRPIEPEDHGTHVAGTIAAVNNNGIGVSGVAGGNYAAGQPGVRIMSCQIFIQESDRVTGNTSAAIKWGADHGAVISQNSWGYNGGTNGKVPQSDMDAIDYFNKYAGVDENGNQTGPMKGGVVFFSAGNEHWRFSAPAAYEGCVAVGAVDARYKAASYSNYGEWVDIAAPGGDTDYSGPAILSTVTNNKYTFYEGTSMACPHVSGVAALILSVLGGPGFTRDMLIDRILNNTTNLAIHGTTDIGNLVNAYAAIEGSSKIPPRPVKDVELSVVSNRIHFKLKVPADPDDGTPYGITAWYDTTQFTSLVDLPSMSFEVGDLVAGDYMEGDVDGLEFEKEYYIGFDAYDLSANHSELTEMWRVKTGPNTPPVIKGEASLDNVVVKYCETKEIGIKYYDPDGHDVTLAFSDNSGRCATVTDMPEQGRCVVKIKGSDEMAGSYAFTMKVTDRYGLSTSLEVPYTIKHNTPPKVLREIGNMVLDLYKDKRVVALKDFFYDDDGEPLAVSYTVSDKSVLRITETAMNGLALTPLSQGLVDVVVSMTDGMGKVASSAFKVLVRDNTVPFDVYPNPVTDGRLYIRGGAASSVKVLVSGPSGAAVFNGSIDIDPFAPSVIDLSGCSTGAYSVKVSNDKESVSTTIINIHND